MMDVVSCWVFSDEEPGVVTGPSGARYEVAPSREIAVRVVSVVLASLERKAPGCTHKARHAYTLEEFFHLLFVSCLNGPEDVAGAGLTQLLDVTCYQLEWHHVTPGVASA